jgi:hypothetical protein
MLLFQEQSHIRLLPIFGVILILTFFISSCKEDNPPDIPEESTGKIVFHFYHQIDGYSIDFDTLIYENAAGNPYLVNEIQYFISDVTLYNSDGTEFLIDDWKDIHYVDTDLPATHTWEVFDKIPVGTYDSVAFTFGFSEEKNISFMFVNPPESYMFWPEFLGGGYHYLKLNGKWLEEGQTTQTTPFDFHMGIGQIYYSYPDSITGFIHNYFRVSLPGSGFDLAEGEQKEMNIIMNVENWFQHPHVYDHDVWGGYIMQNQDAMQKAKENGSNVFSTYFID